MGRERGPRGGGDVLLDADARTLSQSWTGKFPSVPTCASAGWLGALRRRRRTGGGLTPCQRRAHAPGLGFLVFQIAPLEVTQGRCQPARDRRMGAEATYTKPGHVVSVRVGFCACGLLRLSFRRAGVGADRPLCPYSSPRRHSDGRRARANTSNVHSVSRGCITP